jgi:hypothetical protein
VISYKSCSRRLAICSSRSAYLASIDEWESGMLLLLRRMVLVGLALASAGLGVALSLSLTPSSAILRSIPLWETQEIQGIQESPSPHASPGRDIV